MKVFRLPDRQTVADAAADRLCRLLGGVAAEKRPTLGLPTGRTAIPFYAALRCLYQDGTLDLSEARSFNLDELLIPADHPASFYRFMETHAWSRIGLAREHFDIPWSGPQSCGSIEDECLRYDRALDKAGGLDIAVLGVGADGHVAYNLPGRPIAKTHIVEVPSEVANQLGLGNDDRPLRAITLGMDALLNARHVLLMATGSSKRHAIRALVNGPEDPDWPCSLLRAHPSLEVFVDHEAAQELPSSSH